jgi:hypothetical protein
MDYAYGPHSNAQDPAPFWTCLSNNPYDLRMANLKINSPVHAASILIS